MVEAIIIGMGLFVIILCIAALAKGTPTGTMNYEAPHLPDGEEYTNKHSEIPHYDGTLADKVDTRFTNIVKNPWEGIL